MSGEKSIDNSYAEFEEASKTKVKERYLLRLYVSGMTSRSLRAIDNLKKICEDSVQGCYDLEVIDISQHPEAVTKKDVIATPTLVKELPKPIRRIIGDLSDTEKILVALNLSPTKKK